VNSPLEHSCLGVVDVVLSSGHTMAFCADSSGSGAARRNLLASRFLVVLMLSGYGYNFSSAVSPSIVPVCYTTLPFYSST
jgi:hypothetical protein